MSVFAGRAFMKSNVLWVIAPCLVIGSLLLAVLASPAGMPAAAADQFSGAAITIYQVNVAHVVVNVTTTFQNGQARVEIPSSAIVYSLRVSDSRITSWRVASGQSAPSLLQLGDSVVVRTQSNSYSGNYLGQSEGYLVLEVNGETALVRVDSVISIEIRRLVSIAQSTGRTEIILEGNLTGPQSVTIAFLVRGMSWLAMSELDLTSSILSTRAYIWSSDNWTDASIKLVVGEPKIELGPELVRADYTGSAYAANAPASVGVEMTGAYYAFALPGRVTLNSAEELALRILSGEVQVVQFHQWVSYDPRYVTNTEQSAELALNITNALRIPVPWGYLSFYEGNDWLASTSNNYVPVGATRTFTAGPSRDIGVLSEVVSTERTSTAIRYSVKITARNYGSESALVVLRQWLPTESEVTARSGQPAETPTSLTWTLLMKPGDINTFTFTFEVPLR